MTKGTVTKVRKNGRWYSMLVDDQWYGLGSNTPEFAEGNMIEFEVTENGDFKNAKNVKVLGKAAKPQTSSSRVVHNNDKDNYWQNKEARDIQNDKMREVGAGRNTAIAFVDLLIKTNSLPLPKTQAKQADAIFEAVEYYRAKFASATDTNVVDSTSAEEPDDVEEESDDYE